MKRVAIIGTGTMAAGIAAGFISQSVPVAILGRDEEKSRSCLKKSITLAQKIGLHGINATKTFKELEATQITSTLAIWYDWDQCQWLLRKKFLLILIKRSLTIFQSAAIALAFQLARLQKGSIPQIVC